MRLFLPKQRDTDNRVIPYQLYWHELNEILKNAERYLPLLSQKDESGLSVADKILSVFLFRVPYYVGPLNTTSERAWVVRKPGKIYPWNFEKMVNFDASEDAFIRTLIGKCTYIPGEYVLPKDSLLYHKFTVLNEINNLQINGERIPVELKQRIYEELFKVFASRRKTLLRYSLVYIIDTRGKRPAQRLVVSDKEITDAGLPLHLAQNLHDLRLRNDVEHTRRLIEDDKSGL